MFLPAACLVTAGKSELWDALRSIAAWLCYLESNDMESSLTWLDFSEHERRRMLDVIALFGESGTRDELGIGSIRDGFADLLFPGTSTIQTRARYFLFVPWIYSILEGKPTPSAKVANNARKLETALIYSIEETADTDGLIGKLAKENVLRLPSDIYWMGLATWGIRVFVGSREQYYRSLDYFYIRRKGRSTRPKDFRDESWIESELTNWHSGLPEIPDDFPESATFALTRTEAEYLRERVVVKHPRSLLAYILREEHRVESVEWCWDLANVVTEPLREQLQHGQNFSEIMLGAQLLYNFMLAELRPWAEKIDDYQARLQEWRHLMTSKRSSLHNWDRTRFWQIVWQGNPRISTPARSFVNCWIDLVLKSAHGDDMTQNAAARKLVSAREHQLKKGLSRLYSRRALELWNGAAGAGQLDLRWSAARRILNDILEGLEQPSDA